MFYGIESYPQLKVFEENFQAIQQELLAVMNQPVDLMTQSSWMQERPKLVDSQSKGWRTYVFRFFGIDHEPNQRSCPITSKIIRQIPGIVTAEFSMLTAQTHILPHRGYTKDVMRSHLGLVIPKGDVLIRTDKEEYHWKEGEIMVFNDRERHEAWNFTNEDRFVLMFDFVPSFDDSDAKKLCQHIFTETQDEYTLNIADRATWLDWLAHGKFPF